MLDLLKFYRHFRKNRYAQALACLRPHSGIALSALPQYALYRLGMYRSVASCNPVHNHWRSLFAIIVSLAACGQRDKAASLFQDKAILRALKSHKVNLSTALLAFYPELAYQLLPSDAPLPLKVAVWLSQGLTERAKTLLKQNTGIFPHHPDCYLLHCNAQVFPPIEQLQQINAFLQAYHIEPMALKKASLPVGAMNMAPAGTLPTVDGPLVSILMTAFNSADRITPAIESLLQQTYQNLEVIVVDDASSDSTEATVKKIAAQDDRVRYTRLPVNVGTFVAKTIGLQLAQGDFVICHDSDDWAHPQKIALQVAPLLKNKKLVFTVSDMVRVRDDGCFYARQIYPLTRINSSSVLFRKATVLDHAGAWDSVRTGADSEFLARLKIVFGAKNMKRIKKPLSFCAHRPNSLMTSATSGYNDHGIAPDRLTYWESFTHWHIHELRQGRLPKLPPLEASLSHRPFEVPESIKVPPEDIEQCLSELGLKTS